mgnify:CR=1 FL=1
MSRQSNTSVPILGWTVHLARQQPARAWGVLLAILGASVLAWWALGAPAYGLLAAFLLIMSLSDFYFPVKFELMEQGARESCLGPRRYIQWKEVRQVFVDAKGVKLSPLAKESRLEAYRGLYLRFADNAELVEETVRRLWEKAKTDEELRQ